MNEDVLCHVDDSVHISEHVRCMQTEWKSVEFRFILARMLYLNSIVVHALGVVAVVPFFFLYIFNFVNLVILAQLQPTNE